MGGYGILAAALTFASVFFFVFALNLALTDVFKKDQSENVNSTDETFREFERAQIREAINNRREMSLGDLAKTAAGEEAVRHSFWQRLNELCSQSGLVITATRIVIYGLALAVVVGPIVGLLSRNWIAGPVSALAASVLPLGYVARARKQRLETLREQLPDAFELMSRILRSGQTINQGMNAVAEEFKPPVAAEFGYCYEQQNLGLNAEIALRELAGRTGLMELKIFVLAVLVHRQSGGNLTELLDKLAHIVRQRLRLRGDIKGLTAEGRMQAAILLGLPVVVWIGMYFINRPYAMKLFDHPTLVIATMTSMLIGALWINKIVNFDF